MKVIFLGTSHGYPEKGRFCTSTMVLVGKKCYVIDAGAPIATLIKNYDVDYRDVQGIFITHAHDDHFFGLIEYSKVVNKYRLSKGIRSKVYVPTRHIYKGFLNIFKAVQMSTGRTKHILYKSGVIFDDGTAKITAIRTWHTPHSYAFIFEAEGKRVFFSGDLCDNMPDYPKILFKEHFDMLILEGAHTTMNSKNVLDKVNDSNIDRFYINHISPRKNPEDQLKEMISKVKPTVKAYIAEDGMEVEL